MSGFDELPHLDALGRAHMVDVTDKSTTVREAEAEGFVRMSAAALKALSSGAKGDALAVARVAGITAAKRTAELVPLAHPIPLSHVAVTVEAQADRVRIAATVKSAGATGVEMEALTAVSVAALTVYDMLKAVDRGMGIDGVRLLRKVGGRRGDYQAEAKGSS